MPFHECNPLAADTNVCTSNPVVAAPFEGTAARMCLEVAELKTLRTELVTIVAVAPPSTAGAVFAVAAR